MFFRKEGTLPNSKTFQELSCFIVENFQEEGGGYRILKMMRIIFLLWLGYFWSKIGDDLGGCQNLSHLRNFSQCELSFFFIIPQRSLKKQGVGQGNLENTQKGTFFFVRMSFLSILKKSISIIWILLSATVFESTNITPQVEKKILDTKWMKEGIHLNKEN